MIQPPPATLLTYGGETGLALLAGLVVAATQLSTALCGGDEVVEGAKRRKAWASFWIALLAAPLFGGTMTQPVVALTHSAAPWPAAAVVIGISANTVWPSIGPMVRFAAQLEFKARFRAALAAFGKEPA